MGDKDKRVKRIIQALSEKTVENGATEEEAMRAAAKAKELMDKYEIMLTDEQIVEEGAIKRVYKPQNREDSIIVRWASREIADFAEVKVYTDEGKYGSPIKPLAIVGLPSDVEFFDYLIRSLTMFARTGAIGLPARDRYQFFAGYADRITARLRKTIEERDTARNAAPGTASRALVIADLKKTAAEAWLVAAGVKLRKATYYRSGRHNKDAYEAGQARADRAQFCRPVGKGGGALKIEYKR
jgi:hypothetical protein